MLPNEYQKAALRTECTEETALLRMCETASPLGLMNESPLLHNIRLNHVQAGLMTEVGEFATALKKHIFYGKPLDIQNLKEELGDLLWYIALGCSVLKCNMADVMEANISKLRARYPEKFTDFHAADENRDLAAEQKAIEARFEALEKEHLGDSDQKTGIYHPELGNTSSSIVDAGSKPVTKQKALSSISNSLEGVERKAQEKLNKESESSTDTYRPVLPLPATKATNTKCANPGGK